MMKKILFAGALASLFVACGDSSSSSPSEPGMSEAVEVSSSSETVESSSSEQGAVESSSDVAEESSSSQYRVFHYDEPPIDTTSVKPDIYGFEPVDESDRKMYGENVYWLNQKNYEGYCYTTDEPNGELGGGFMSSPFLTERVIIVREDSLLYADMHECTEYDWEGCRNAENAYYKKIEVCDDVFYYGKFKTEIMLVKLTDSTVTVWTISNPSYNPPPAVDGPTGWPKSFFEGNSLVTFVGDDPNSDYVDTIYIEKYNVKITDYESTWIFENETCTDRGYKKTPEMGSDESCYARIKYHNESKACIKRNLGTASFVRLCRPQKDVYASWKVWCILDQEKPDAQ